MFPRNAEGFEIALGIVHARSFGHGRIAKQNIVFYVEGVLEMPLRSVMKGDDVKLLLVGNNFSLKS